MIMSSRWRCTTKRQRRYNTVKPCCSCYRHHLKLWKLFFANITVETRFSSALHRIPHYLKPILTPTPILELKSVRMHLNVYEYSSGHFVQHLPAECHLNGLKANNPVLWRHAICILSCVAVCGSCLGGWGCPRAFRFSVSQSSSIITVSQERSESKTQTFLWSILWKPAGGPATWKQQ